MNCEEEDEQENDSEKIKVPGKKSNESPAIEKYVSDEDLYEPSAYVFNQIING